MGSLVSLSRMHLDLEPAFPRTAAVSETSRSIVRTATVHGKFCFALRMYCDHEPQTENPKGIPQQSPGLPSIGQSGSDRGYPGIEASVIYNPNGVAPYWAPSVHGEPPSASHMHWNLEPRGGLLPLLLWQDQLGRRRGPGRGGHWNLDLGASLGFGAWDLELPLKKPGLRASMRVIGADINEEAVRLSGEKLPDQLSFGRRRYALLCNHAF